MSILSSLVRATVALTASLPLVLMAQQDSYVGGEVMFVSGQAQRQKSGGVTEAVAKGMTLLEGDRIKTSADSHVYVRLRDGGLLVVRPASELHVDLWRYDPARPQDSMIKYTLDSGVARHVSGQGAKAARDKFRFNTPMAAIGVRGTDFTVLANPAFTRISVQSGGVIVNALGNGCRAEALGPCEGASAVELFASARDKLLQLRAGERRPELIEDATATPDRQRPPASGEPVVQRKAPADTPIVAESRTQEFVVLAEKTAPPPVVTPPVVVEPPPAPQITVASWGRWAPLAAGDTSMISLEEFLKTRTMVGYSSSYVLAQDLKAAAVELPGAGQASFKLNSHDGIATNTDTGERSVSVASDASLMVDFGARRFQTAMTITAPGVSTIISGSGSIESNGRFTSDQVPGVALIQGVIGGKQASEAVYLYQRALRGYEVSGVASWLR